MLRYSADHTGPKTQFGGLELGFASPAYQLGILEAVTMPPIPAATKQTDTKTSSPSH